MSMIVGYEWMDGWIIQNDGSDKTLAKRLSITAFCLRTIRQSALCVVCRVM